MNIIHYPEDRLIKKQISPPWLEHFINTFPEYIPLTFIIGVSTTYVIQLVDKELSNVLEDYHTIASIFYYDPNIYDKRTYPRYLLQKKLDLRKYPSDNIHMWVLYLAYYVYPDPIMHVFESPKDIIIHGIKFRVICYTKKVDGIILKYNYLLNISGTGNCVILRAKLDRTPVINIQQVYTTPSRSRKRREQITYLNVPSPIMIPALQNPEQLLYKELDVINRNDMQAQILSREHINQIQQPLQHAIRKMYEL